MQPMHRVTPDELATLRMENELLRYEVRHLSARLREAEAAGGEPASAHRGVEVANVAPQTRDDLVWLLRRIDDVPLVGRLLRRRPGVQTLRERYLEGPAA
ncbi:hypothetical protein [Nocardioides perillae]|uniref:Uncharacterized protein n=1 Tax=Nocardioides perillae TaxID=1119534 RepID=A0A7Y9RY41_9ACTN|nr:hypothetical protein [Nocardioides perillae]NYG56868.1 hypothetical protein [Nocardioides perillae]